MTSSGLLSSRLNVEEGGALAVSFVTGLVDVVAVVFVVVEIRKALGS